MNARFAFIAQYVTLNKSYLEFHLARFSIHVPNYLAWMEEVPHTLLSVAEQDVANLAFQVQ